MMMGISVSAQEFNPHWYLQLRGGAAETVGETNFKDLYAKVFKDRDMSV